MVHEAPSASLEDAIRSYFEAGSTPGVVSAYLFGSETRGTAHRESDVDVGVLVDRRRIPEKEERSELRVRLGSGLIAALARNDVDVVILNDVPPGLGRVVVQKGRRVYCADEELDHAFVRDVQLRAADLDPFLERMQAIKLGALRA